MSEVAKGKLHLILRLEVSQLSKPRVSDFGTTAINTLITVPIHFLQSGHFAKIAKQIIRATSAMASTAWYNGADPLETSDERVPKVNQDYWCFFANLDIKLLYIHLLAIFQEFNYVQVFEKI